MAGHSTWSKVKCIEGLPDQQWGRLFTLLAPVLTVAQGAFFRNDFR